MASEKVRADIFETGNPKIKAARIVISAPPTTIFNILADPRKHQLVDGSKTIKANISGPERLTLGSRFGMAMHLGIDYRIMNTVMEFEENKVIAWRHIGRWRWRYELKDLGNGSTEVTETFDGSYVPYISQSWLNFRKAYPWTQMVVAKSLVRLKEVVES